MLSQEYPVADPGVTRYREDKKLSGVIYMHRISDFKMGGVSRRNFGMFRSLCGEATLKNVVIVTNMWSEVAEQKGVAREHELATDGMLFKPVLDKGAQMMRHLNTLDSAQNILRRFVENRPLPLQIQHEMVDQQKALEQTAASEVLKTQEMLEAQRRQEEERRRQREAAEAARRAHEAEKARQLANAQAAAQQQRAIQEAQARAERERIRSEQEAARRREEERLRQVQLALEAQAAARRAEEERLRQIREQQQREAQAAEEARRRHLAEMERIRREEDSDSDDGCRIS